MLFAPLNFGGDPLRLEMRLEPAADPLDQVAAALMKMFEPLGDRRISVGLELTESERLHLRHEFIHADPLRERGIDIHRLARDAAALILGFYEMERAHIMKPVGKLYQQ